MPTVWKYWKIQTNGTWPLMHNISEGILANLQRISNKDLLELFIFAVNKCGVTGENRSEMKKYFSLNEGSKINLMLVIMI